MNDPLASAAVAVALTMASHAVILYDCSMKKMKKWFFFFCTIRFHVASTEQSLYWKMF